MLLMLTTTLVSGQITRNRVFSLPGSDEKKRIEVIDKILISKKDSAELYVERGQLVMTLNVNEPSQQFVKRTNAQALSDIDRGISLRPAKPEFYKIKADYFFYVHDDFPSAIQNMSKAIQLDSTNCAFYQRRAMLYFKNNDKDSACKDWNKCAVLNCKEAEGCVSFVNDYCK